LKTNPLLLTWCIRL